MQLGMVRRPPFKTTPLNFYTIKPHTTKYYLIRSAWSGNPDQICGPFKEQRHPIILSNASACGAACPTAVEERTSKTWQLPRDCIASWGEWSSCSAKCGESKKTRCLAEKEPASNCPHSKPCSMYCESKPCTVNGCNKVDCPPDRSRTKNCTWAWNEWDKCTHESICDVGVKVRTRRILEPALCGGAMCPTSLQRSTEGCAPAVKRDCTWKWAPWEEGGCVCGSGMRTRVREILQAPSKCGQQCPSPGQTMSDACPLSTDPKCCKPQNCTSEWSEWSPCIGECNPDGTNDNGVQQRYELISRQAECGGHPCGNNPDIRKCKIPACQCVQQDCEVDQWAPWAKCSSSCFKTRTRPAKRPRLCGGKRCERLVETAQCEQGEGSCLAEVNTTDALNQPNEDCLVTPWEV